MSAAVPLALLIVVMLGVAAGVVVSKTSRNAGYGSSVPIAIIIGTLTSFLLFMPTVRWLAYATTTTVIEMDPREGEERLAYVGLPANTTSDFCYRFSITGINVLADFDIAAADFIRWMDSQNWQWVEFDLPHEYADVAFPGQGRSRTPVVHPVRLFESGETLTVQRGYLHFSAKPDNPDDTITAIYDLDTGRAYFMHTTY